MAEHVCGVVLHQEPADIRHVRASLEASRQGCRHLCATKEAPKSGPEPKRVARLCFWLHADTVPGGKPPNQAAKLLDEMAKKALKDAPAASCLLATHGWRNDATSV